MSWKEVREMVYEFADSLRELTYTPPPWELSMSSQEPADPHVTGAPDPGEPQPFPMDPLKPGRETSEFKTTIAAQVIAVGAAAAAVFVPGFPAEAAGEVVGWALGAVGVTTGAYSWGRSVIKRGF